MLIFISVLPSRLKLFLLAKCGLIFLFNERKKTPIAHGIFLLEVPKAQYFVLPSYCMLSVHSEVVLHRIRFHGESEL